MNEILWHKAQIKVYNDSNKNASVFLVLDAKNRPKLNKTGSI